ncbi:MAG: AMP-binding protein [Rhodopseudomonas palustris]|nr:AMP-binding protein [Rhodopseudomonas palustris]
MIDVDDPAFGAGRRIGEIEYEAAAGGGRSRVSPGRRPDDEWDAIALSYTSGTTGNPKGVVTHHRGAYLNAVSNIIAAWTMASIRSICGRCRCSTATAGASRGPWRRRLASMSACARSMPRAIFDADPRNMASPTTARRADRATTC